MHLRHDLEFSFGRLNEILFFAHLPTPGVHLSTPEKKKDNLLSRLLRPMGGSPGRGLNKWVCVSRRVTGTHTKLFWSFAAASFTPLARLQNSFFSFLVSCVELQKNGGASQHPFSTGGLGSHS